MHVCCIACMYACPCHMHTCHSQHTCASPLLRSANCSVILGLSARIFSSCSFISRSRRSCNSSREGAHQQSYSLFITGSITRLINRTITTITAPLQQQGRTNSTHLSSFSPHQRPQPTTDASTTADTITCRVHNSATWLLINACHGTYTRTRIANTADTKIQPNCPQTRLQTQHVMPGV
jgi:hypothetical protein